MAQQAPMMAPFVSFQQLTYFTDKQRNTTFTVGLLQPMHVPTRAFAAQLQGSQQWLLIVMLERWQGGN
jgi:hypothetical protein